MSKPTGAQGSSSNSQTVDVLKIVFTKPELNSLKFTHKKSKLVNTTSETAQLSLHMKQIHYIWAIGYFPFAICVYIEMRMMLVIVRIQIELENSSLKYSAGTHSLTQWLTTKVKE